MAEAEASRFVEALWKAEKELGLTGEMKPSQRDLDWDHLRQAEILALGIESVRQAILNEVSLADMTARRYYRDAIVRIDSRGLS